MKKNNIIYNAKKNLDNNTEEETNMVIKQSINVIRDCINPTYKIIEPPKTIEKKKFLSESELAKAKKIINNKISVEEKIIEDKIKNYLERVKEIKLSNIKNNDIFDYKMQRINKEKNRDFYYYAKHFYLNDNDIKMIHYKKLPPQPIRDKSCPNLKNIKENLFPNIRTGHINNENYVNINNSNGVKLIKGMKFYRKYGMEKKINNEDENKSNNSDITINNQKDSFNILKKIIIRNKSLIKKSSNKYNKLSSLLDLNLPKISDYETIINKEKLKEEEEKKNKTVIMNENIINNKIIRNKTQIPSIFSNSSLMKEFREIKDEIKFLKGKKIDLDENYKNHQKELSNAIYIFEKKRIKKKKENIMNEEGLINKKIIAENPRMRMPSSHSVSILKRKSIIDPGIINKYNKIYNRNYSNHTRDRTRASSPIMYSASSIITTNKSKNDNNYKELYKNIKKVEKNKIINRLENNLIFSFPQEKSYNYSKNNINSSNITSMSDN